jgi:hypothetical protein
MTSAEPDSHPSLFGACIIYSTDHHHREQFHPPGLATPSTQQLAGYFSMVRQKYI